jgi:hypothetical protein
MSALEDAADTTSHSDEGSQHDPEFKDACQPCRCDRRYFGDGSRHRRVAAELGASVTVVRESPRPDRTAPTQNWTICALRPS